MEHFPFPLVNASLNGLSAVLLTAAYVCIRQRRVRSHRALMLGALGVSTVFLVSYLTGHAIHGATRFPNQSPWRMVYLMILASHTILAVATVPLVILALRLALRRRWASHHRLATWTLPIWVYVSVTGVIIYLMLAGTGAYSAHSFPLTSIDGIMAGLVP